MTDLKHKGRQDRRTRKEGKGNTMNKIMEKLEGPLTKLASKFAQNSIINIISGAFMMTLPITMVGGFIALIRGLEVAPYQAFLASTGLYNHLGTIYQFTTSFFAVYVAFAIAYTYCNRYNMKASAIPAGLTAIMSFFVATPYTLPESLWGSATLDTSWHGASGLFSAMVIGFIVGSIYKFCKDKNIAIKLPEQVPPAIAAQFTAILPTAFAGLFFMVVAWLFEGTSFGSIHNAIYTILRAPLGFLGANIFGQTVLALFCGCLWFLGIHGGMTVIPMIMMLFTGLQMENQMAYSAGQPLPNWITGSCLSLSSGSLCVVICCLLFAKSEQIKAIAKAALIPSLFGVDEPAYFGLPMILNPLFFLPWVLFQNLLTNLGTYLLQAIGVLGYYRGVNIGSFVPFFVSNLVGYGIPGLIWGFVLFAIDMVLTLPFVLTYDKQLLAEEQAAAENK